MRVTGELRWFWRGSPPDDVRRWFESGPLPPALLPERADVYLRNGGDADLGIKERGGGAGVEIKGRIGELPLRSGAFAGAPELWGKWACATLDLTGRATVRVVKRRALRVVRVAERVDEVPAAGEHPEQGCQIELTLIDVDGIDAAGSWSTLGFEAFGPLGALDEIFERALAHVAEGAPDLDGDLLSYPAWLAALC